MPTLIYSLLDAAGPNITSNLIEKFGFKKSGGTESNVFSKGNMHLIGVNERLISMKDLDERFKADLLIFLSTHKSESGLKCLTAHIPGNWAKAELGGEDKKICFSHPSKLKTILKEISKLAKGRLDWPVYLEADHHGPFANIPSIFVEIGSSESEWRNKVAGEIIAEAVIKGLMSEEKFEVAFCVGGGHYAPAFTKTILETETAVSHVLPKYSVDEVDFETFKQGVERSIEPAEFVLLDWKGMNKEQRDKIIKFTDVLGLEYKRA
jgi:D-aminoacyl-tRNA deacylase